MTTPREEIATARAAYARAVDQREAAIAVVQQSGLTAATLRDVLIAMSGIDSALVQGLSALEHAVRVLDRRR